tara:strand:- start:3959 stop:4084 length:126 start_codon:yes stop_codon:yes gene_type:complete
MLPSDEDPLSKRAAPRLVGLEWELFVLLPKLPQQVNQQSSD